MNNIEKDTESEFNTMESQQIRMSGIEDMVASNNMTAMQCFNQMKNLVNSALKDRQVNKTMSDQNKETMIVPKGWKLVPKVPSQEMLDAVGEGPYAEVIWGIMMASVPEQEQDHG